MAAMRTGLPIANTTRFSTNFIEAAGQGLVTNAPGYTGINPDSHYSDTSQFFEFADPVFLGKRDTGR
jgi:hypothetical protein